jgi:hypothetical protein
MESGDEDLDESFKQTRLYKQMKLKEYKF